MEQCYHRSSECLCTERHYERVDQTHVDEWHGLKWMFCIHCGAALLGTAKFCQACGERVEAPPIHVNKEVKQEAEEVSSTTNWSPVPIKTEEDEVRARILRIKNDPESVLPRPIPSNLVIIIDDPDSPDSATSDGPQNPGTPVSSPDEQDETEHQEQQEHQEEGVEE